jgi:hypothetical protein
MKKFGSVRNIWEGGVEGEGFLRKYKKELKNGLKPQWQIYTIKNLLQRGVFNKIQIDTTNNWKERIFLECRIYQSMGVVKNAVTNNKPLSCVIDDATKQIYILFREKKIIKAIKVNIAWNSATQLNKLRYYELQLMDDVIEMNNDLGSTVIGCILLPSLTSKVRSANAYCMVYSDWRVKDNVI